MRTYDLTPLFRSTIGFDRLFDFVETTQRAGEDNYPPYNIERLSDDRYRISLAVAGFSPDEISVTAEQNVVTIEGNKVDKAEGEYLYRGISARQFKRQFSLADYVQVKGATFDNGLLRIELVREILEAHETTADCNQRIERRQRPSDRGQSGLIQPLQVYAARRPTRGIGIRLENGGDHAADDRLR
jgi:molecular chaperone IbpA